MDTIRDREREAGTPMDERRPTPPAPPLTPEQVFQDYAPRIYHLARRMLGSDADAEDVTQEVLLQVVRKLDTFRGESAFSTWLHRITVNAALAYRRKRAIRQNHQVSDPLEHFLENGYHTSPIRPWSVEPQKELLDRETHQLIEHAIQGLPEIYRDVYVLADVEGLSNAEIGQMLGLGLAAVKSRLHRARLLMRNALAPHFEEVLS
jgi:RNA polymerase sigma-70 factor (ECF subfamily)